VRPQVGDVLRPGGHIQVAYDFELTFERGGR
jgi:hypothetical protein